MFTGTLRVKICEANDLRPTDYQKRHELNFGKNNDKKDLDPYVSLNVDEKFIGECKSHAFDAHISSFERENCSEKFFVKIWVDKNGAGYIASIFQRLFFFSLTLFSLSHTTFSPRSLVGRQSSAMFRMLSVYGAKISFFSFSLLQTRGRAFMIEPTGFF